jgi:hypothetical protein
VAHEAFFRRWEKLKEWIAAEREFLVWRNGLEVDRRRWETAPESSRNEALLVGLSLVQAKECFAKRAKTCPVSTAISLQRALIARRWNASSANRNAPSGSGCAACCCGALSLPEIKSARNDGANLRGAAWRRCSRRLGRRAKSVRPCSAIGACEPRCSIFDMT